MDTEIVTESNDDVGINADDLDAFSNEFFETGPKAEEVPSEDVPSETLDEPGDEDAPETDDETDVGEAEEPTDEVEDDEPEEETKLFKVKRKKSVGERIREVTAARHEAERRADDLERRLAEIEQSRATEKVEEPRAKPAADLEGDAPDPDEQLDDGAQKYPLGEFDPKYIRDLTRFTIAKETEAARARESSEREAAQMHEAEQSLHNHWTEKLAAVDPELKAGLEASAPVLEDTFRNINADYGKYLSSTIMAMEYGPQVLHYLASNISEAKRIVASGPTAATIALGRIEARFDTPKEPSNERKVRETKAPPPPPTNRGSGGKFSVAPDTDDLDAFEKAFFSKKK